MIEKALPPREQLVIEACEKMLLDWIVGGEQIGRTAKSRPPEMGKSLDMIRPIVDRSKWHFEKLIKLNLCIEVFDDLLNVAVGEQNFIDGYRVGFFRKIVMIHVYTIEMYLNQEQRLVTLGELSDRIGVSKNNLIKVSNQLSKLGLIDTARGRAGGLTIGKGTGQKTIREIVEKTEETFYIAQCFAKAPCECGFLKTCLLRKKLEDAIEVFLASLGQTTLNEVTPERSRVRAVSVL